MTALTDKNPLAAPITQFAQQTAKPIVNNVITPVANAAAKSSATVATSVGSTVNKGIGRSGSSQTGLQIPGV